MPRPGGYGAPAFGVLALGVLAIGALALPGCGPSDAARGRPRQGALCPAGVVARLAGPVSFTDGWVRLPLAPCAGHAAGEAAARLEVSADGVLTFTKGRPGGATVGLLGGSPAASTSGALQRFELPPGSAQARELVLAPWSGPAPPRVAAARLMAAAP